MGELAVAVAGDVAQLHRAVEDFDGRAVVGVCWLGAERQPGAGAEAGNVGGAVVESEAGDGNWIGHDGGPGLIAFCVFHGGIVPLGVGHPQGYPLGKREYVVNANCVLGAGLGMWQSRVHSRRSDRKKDGQSQNIKPAQQALVFIVLVPICVIYILPIFSETFFARRG